MNDTYTHEQKIIVTGGAGFVGANLLRILKERYNSATLVSVDVRTPLYPIDGVIYEQCDVRDAERLNVILQNSSKIFHLAAIIGTHESFDDPRLVFDTNVGGTLNILEHARKNGTEVFVAGMPGIWNNPYSISKDACVRLAKSYFETYNVKVSVLRWFSIYGPYQYVSRYNKAVPTFIHNALNNLSLPVYGDGTQVADFIYVDDAVTMAIEMLEYQYWGKVVECATGVGSEVNTLANEIIRLTDSTSKIEHLPMRSGEPEHAKIVADTTELDSLLHYKQKTLAEGLEKTIAYYKENPQTD